MEEGEEEGEGNEDGDSWKIDNAREEAENRKGIAWNSNERAQMNKAPMPLRLIFDS